MKCTRSHYFPLVYNKKRIKLGQWMKFSLILPFSAFIQVHKRNCILFSNLQTWCLYLSSLFTFYVSGAPSDFHSINFLFSSFILHPSDSIYWSVVLGFNHQLYIVWQKRLLSIVTSRADVEKNVFKCIKN